MTLREELEQIFVFETTELKFFQDAADGDLDISGLDLNQLLAICLVTNRAVRAMVMRVADEVEALRD